MFMRKWLFRGLAAVILLAGGIYAGVKFIDSRTHEGTDNAFVTGTVVRVSSEVKGRVIKVSIEDNEFVAAGQAMIEICQDDYRNILQENEDEVLRTKAEDRELRATIEQRYKVLEQSRAGLAASLAEEDMALKELMRYKALQSKGVVSQSEFDRVESQWKVACARRQAASASVQESESGIVGLQAKLKTQEYKIREARTGLRKAELDLARTVVTAPVAGRVAVKNVDPGKYVQPGQPLLAIVEQDTWVVANFKETQIRKMAVGQPVKVKVDAYPGVAFSGHVDSLQPGTGAVFTLLPPENASGNFVKVVQRIPVKIVVDSPFDPDHPLRPGLSVHPVVDIGVKGMGKVSRRAASLF
ncbi:MAG TPA: HlyD family secretion protein [Deltaproteobacteria bacterium]|nr:HlyD family secretion protein [Deltaproteobacteria bacterium]HXK46687.1 HlyD family secretion protein [Deltaproteobacteria bacterium]